MSLAEVLSRVSPRRRHTLKHILTPTRYEAVLQGLAERRWSTVEQARKDLRVSRGSMVAIRSALRVSGVMPWEGGPAAFTLDTPSKPTQQRLFTKAASGYRYTHT